MHLRFSVGTPSLPGGWKRSRSRAQGTDTGSHPELRQSSRQTRQTSDCLCPARGSAADAHHCIHQCPRPVVYFPRKTLDQGACLLLTSHRSPHEDGKPSAISGSIPCELKYSVALPKWSMLAGPIRPRPSTMRSMAPPTTLHPAHQQARQLTPRHKSKQQANIAEYVQKTSGKGYQKHPTSSLTGTMH